MMATTESDAPLYAGAAIGIVVGTGLGFLFKWLFPIRKRGSH